jgi:S-adenosylmethionine synthetase
MTTQAHIDYQKVVRQVIEDIGYCDSALGFDSRSCAVLASLSSQSKDIDQGLTRGGALGAGDQGMMFGCACDQ